MRSNYNKRIPVRRYKHFTSITKNRTQTFLAYLGVGAFFSMTAYILFRGLGNMAAEESFIVGNLTGMAGAIASTVYNYYFGSSKGERENRQVIQKK